MNKIDFKRYLGTSGREIQSRIESAALYRHPTGTGDAREDVLLQFLRDTLSPRFVVERGKLFDSNGRLSREFDMLISESGEVVPTIRVGDRRLVPIEAVYGVVEIKSKLDKKAYNTTIDAIVELDRMRRFYKPLHPPIEAKIPADGRGIAPQDPTFGYIWSGIVAFDAPNAKTLAKYLERHCEGFWFLCVPGRELVTKWANPPGFRGIPYREYSLPLLVWLIMNLVADNKRPRFLQPDYSRYRKSMLESIGNLRGGWSATARTGNK